MLSSRLPFNEHWKIVVRRLKIIVPRLAACCHRYENSSICQQKLGKTDINAGKNNRKKMNIEYNDWVTDNNI
jgi:hypothetical protein